MALEKRLGIGRSSMGWAKESFVMEGRCKLLDVEAAEEEVERSQCPRTVRYHPLPALADIVWGFLGTAHESHTVDFDAKEV